MIRKRLWGAAAFITAARSSAPPAPAASVQADPIRPADGSGSAMAAAMGWDLHLTPAQFTACLADEATARHRESRPRAALKDAYAGFWVTPDGTLVAATTDNSTVKAITAAGARATVAERSLTDLTAITDTLNATARDKPSGSRSRLPWPER